MFIYIYSFIYFLFFSNKKKFEKENKQFFWNIQIFNMISSKLIIQP
jgi:hypothetical protein